MNKGVRLYWFLLMNKPVIDFSLLEGKTIIFTVSETMDAKLLSTMPRYVRHSAVLLLSLLRGEAIGRLICVLQCWRPGQCVYFFS